MDPIRPPSAGSWAALDAAAAESAGVDVVCSSSAWCLSAHESFAEDESPILAWQSDAGIFTAAVMTLADGVAALGPLDAMWAFASPNLGADAGRLAHDVTSVLRSRPEPVALLSGFDHTSERSAHLARALSEHFRLGLGSEMVRQRIDLRGGIDAWLQSRSPKFRAALRRSARLASASGITIEQLRHRGSSRDLLARLAAIEARSWKGAEASGLCDTVMAGFYAAVCDRLGPDSIRVGIARRGGVDVGYIFGAACGTTYRGFQFAFDADVGRIGLGSLLQLRQVQWAAAEGVALYDLGMDVDYKRRWADHSFSTNMLVAIRRP